MQTALNVVTSHSVLDAVLMKDAHTHTHTYRFVGNRALETHITCWTLTSSSVSSMGRCRCCGKNDPMQFEIVAARQQLMVSLSEDLLTHSCPTDKPFPIGVVFVIPSLQKGLSKLQEA